MLIVTIIVLIIISSISITALKSEKGIINKAKNLEIDRKIANLKIERDNWKVKINDNENIETLEQLIQKLLNNGLINNDEKNIIDTEGK